MQSKRDKTKNELKCGDKPEKKNGHRKDVQAGGNRKGTTIDTNT